MALYANEAKEWRSLQAKSKRHGIPVKRVGPANVSFGGDVYAQLGTGRATTIMNARIEVKKRRKAVIKIGTKRTWNGMTYQLIAGGLTKAEARRKAKWSGIHSYTRIERVSRGNHRLWVGPDKPRTK